jgi:hypothetical protein
VSAGAWVEQWLSPDRFARYLNVSGGDRDRALALYEWNAVVAAAVLHDLAHLEIGLRNAYDRVLTQAAPTGQDWTDPAGPLFAPLRRQRNGQSIDINLKSREHLGEARRQARAGAPHGKIVAELSFGFWRYLSSAAHEKSLWVPYLHRAFPRGTRRRQDIDQPLTALHRLRNRAAHHEHLLTEDLPARHAELLALAGRVSPELRAHLEQVSQLPDCLSRRP